MGAMCVVCWLSEWSACGLGLTVLIGGVASFLVLDGRLAFWGVTGLVTLVTCWVTDGLWFFIGFELVLVPLAWLVAMGSARVRRFKAIRWFLVATLAMSAWLLVGLVGVYASLGSLSAVVSLWPSGGLDVIIGGGILGAACVAFGVKLPVMPVHLWLPEAHVEAPTTGSIFLASVLLKVGVIGFLFWGFHFVPLLSGAWVQVASIVLCVGGFLSSLLCIAQLDIKRVIAYSSVAHMHLIGLGIVVGWSSVASDVLLPVVIQSIGHGFSAAMMFGAAGCVIQGYGSRSVSAVSGVWVTMPDVGCVLLVGALANVGCPGTLNFIGEWSLLVVVFQAMPGVACVAALGVLLSSVYTLGCVVRLIGGLPARQLAVPGDYQPLRWSLLGVAVVAVVAGICTNMVFGC